MQNAQNVVKYQIQDRELTRNLDLEIWMEYQGLNHGVEFVGNREIR